MQNDAFICDRWHLECNNVIESWVYAYQRASSELNDVYLKLKPEIRQIQKLHLLDIFRDLKYIRGEIMIFISLHSYPYAS